MLCIISINPLIKVLEDEPSIPEVSRPRETRELAKRPRMLASTPNRDGSARPSKQTRLIYEDAKDNLKQKTEIRTNINEQQLYKQRNARPCLQVLADEPSIPEVFAAVLQSVFGKRQMGSALTGSLQMSCVFLSEGLLGYSR